MTNGLSVSDITPLGERPADIWRGRTGASLSGVDAIIGISIVGTPADGDVLVYDAATDTYYWTTVSALVGSQYLTKYGGEGHDKVTNLAATGAVTIDCSLANIFDLTLTGNVTITITNPPVPTLGGIIEIILRQGGSGSYTVTWPASVYWQAADGTNAGSAPTLHTVVGAQDDITLATLDGGTTWGGEHGGSATGGTVSSVALTVPAEFSVAGSPVTTAGTLAVTKATQSANTVWAGPTSGSAAAPTFRALVAADIPATASGSDHEHVMDCLFSGDASTTVWELPAAPVDAYSVAAYVAGVLTEVTLSGSMLTTATFGSAPGSGTNNVRFDIVAAVL